MCPRLCSSLEVLESRIAPAALFLYGSYSKNYVKFTDVDGDAVTVSFSKSFINSTDFGTIFTFVGSGLGGQLQGIDLLHAPSPTKLAGMNITISVKKEGSGNGLVNVGLIEAGNGISGIDLGNVKVAGDLGAINAGEGRATKDAVKSLTLDSFGAQGVSTQAAGGSLVSYFNGAVPKITVSGDVDGESISSLGNISTITIKGNLDGNTQPGVDGSGQIVAGGNISTLTIDGSVLGTQASDSGEIKSLLGDIDTISIGGSLQGDIGGNTSITADQEAYSGFIVAAGGIKTVTIGQNLTGGAGNHTGEVLVGTAIGTVKIDGNIEPGTGSFSGAVVAPSSLTSLTVEGNIGAGAIVNAGKELGALTVGGSIEGTSSAPVIFSAQGRLDMVAKTDVAFGSIKVTGSMSYAVVLGGYDNTLTPQDPNAQIGAVTVGGNYTASDLVAGVVGTMNGNSFVFGTAADAPITTGVVADIPDIVSKIAGVTIGGMVAGDSISDASYGITAQDVISVKVGSTTEPLLAGAGNNTFAGGTEIALASNLYIDEVDP
jgi:hypothetical protein